MASMMDLDSSLDDIIKHKKGGRGDYKKNTPKTNKHPQQGTPQTARRAGVRTKVPINTKKSIFKPTQRAPAKVTPSKPLFTSKSFTTTAPKIDPSAIVITKSVATIPISGSPTRTPGRFQGRLGKQPSQGRQQQQQKQQQQQQQQQREPDVDIRQRAPPSPPPVVERRPLYQPRSEDRNFSIRGLSHANTPSSGMSIRGESGPSIVLISNLDPEANTEDVRTACLQFGPVLRCEVLTDRMGRSFGEAEVEYSTKTAALDCIAQMDNEVADGRVLRVILRNKQAGTPAPVQSTFAAQTVRSTIAPTRSGYTSAPSSGKLYSDQMIPTGPASNAAPNYARYPARRY
ncbi:hypothetical protein J3Q64DRAFT_1746733 [Phycomyces blakesleeanus]|uniref:RRM domain-containing protein n=2 Tax=Phycomyces blakesleeanus TaxID=4837 RepID=A0A162X354_PHYB8|nr:hypothetical protein PHYBLDRAFT_187344 [Phycomyces blakesleeanus NRRL 1555(-)]OAD72305.1 hypothetical protein PHYBLDRAFT_187344 [Phycomyces blakesleeanus NRRL 1555(-)]|eukprot:XP_018290345.1 hypothetical protein PHYBLDRAFT_187344 [Phycomyces blakesleeanus NRRL 1555(-)]